MSPSFLHAEEANVLKNGQLTDRKLENQTSQIPLAHVLFFCLNAKQL